MSSAVTTYVGPVSPGISVATRVMESTRCHFPVIVSVPPKGSVHVPAVRVIVVPTHVLEVGLIVGAVLFTGTGAS